MKNLFLIFVCASLIFQIFSCSTKNSNNTRYDNESENITLNFKDNRKTKWTSNAELSQRHKEYLGDDKNKIFEEADTSRAYEYVDFNFEDIKHLVWVMQTSADKTFINNPKPEMGLRVYYTKDHENKGLNTVTLAPIFKNKEGKSRLFNPGADENRNGNEVFKDWSLNKEGVIGMDPKKMFMFWFDGDKEGTNLNHVTGCPTRCEEN